MRKLSIILILLCFIGHSSFAQNKCRMIHHYEFNDTNVVNPIKETENFSESMSDGYFYIEGFQRRKISMVFYPIEIDENEDFEIETSIKKISAAKKRNSSGIVFGADGTNFYIFKTNTKGEYKYQISKGSDLERTPWIESEDINKGIGSTNKLCIKKEDNQISFYVNDNLLTTRPFDSFFGNNIGFYIARKQKIAIDYLQVIYLPIKKNIIE